MKVLFIHHGSVLGGAPISLCNTILALKKYAPSIHIKVLCLNETMQIFFREKAGAVVDLIPNPGITLGKVAIGYAPLSHASNRRIFFKELWSIKKIIDEQKIIIDKEKPDIVHLNSSVLFTSAMATKQLGIPLVWHIREVLQGAKNSFRKNRVGRFIVENATTVIAIGKAEAKQLNQEKAKNIRIIPNFLDFDFFDYSKYNIEEERAKFGIKKEEKIILSLGGDNWRKGTLDLLKATKYLSNDIKVLIGGCDKPPINNRSFLGKLRMKWRLLGENLAVSLGFSKNYKKHYLHRIGAFLNRNNLSEKVQFLGLLKDIRPSLAAADIVVALHTTAHSSRTIFEAWALKKTVIGFDISGLSENIDAGINGILVERNPKKLAREIQQLAENLAHQKVLGENGYLTAQKEYDASKNIQALLKIYQEIVSEKQEVVEVNTYK